MNLNRLIFVFVSLMLLSISVRAQEAFTVKHFDVKVKVNKDASLQVSETIDVNFTSQRHGIIRSILYRYPVNELPENVEKADQQLVSGDKLRIIIDDIKVQGHKSTVNKDGDLVRIKIGDKDKYVNGDQQYIISYRVQNAINFFKDHSEFYFNLIGVEWNTTIEKVDFSVELYKPLPATPSYFIATGKMGSKLNQTVTHWEDNQVISGHTTEILNQNEGVTIGIEFPAGFLQQPDFRYYRIGWLVLPLLVFLLMCQIWKKWGKDEKVTIQTEFYPPEKVSPSVSGYIVDSKLDRRDLTALIPYWGAGGYLRINEIEEKVLLGLIKTKDYEFVKLKPLPDDVLDFEKTLFNGIFKTGETVQLKDLKNVLYSTMDKAKKELEQKINAEEFYVTFSRGMGVIFPILGTISIILGIVYMVSDFQVNKFPGIAIIASAIIVFIFGLLMPKKTKKGTKLYAKLLGFKEFLKSVEQDRLKEFLKQDEHYFDKVLPYAIVFDIADTWKDKLKGLDIPPPTWYSAGYTGANFSTMHFMNNLDKSMNAMSQNFYSSPSSGGAGSGGSFSGGGGSGGGGFGGGGGSSW